MLRVTFYLKRTKKKNPGPLFWMARTRSSAQCIAPSVLRGRDSAGVDRPVDDGPREAWDRTERLVQQAWLATAAVQRATWAEVPPDRAAARPPIPGGARQDPPVVLQVADAAEGREARAAILRGLGTGASSTGAHVHVLEQGPDVEVGLGVDGARQEERGQHRQGGHGHGRGSHLHHLVIVIVVVVVVVREASVGFVWA